MRKKRAVVWYGTCHLSFACLFDADMVSEIRNKKAEEHLIRALFCAQRLSLLLSELSSFLSPFDATVVKKKSRVIQQV